VGAMQSLGLSRSKATQADRSPSSPSQLLKDEQFCRQHLRSLQGRVRGDYRNVGTSVVGGMIVGFYFNPVTGQCVQLASANNRVVAARDIGTNPRCR
jgi:hypothetical protein